MNKIVGRKLFWSIVSLITQFLFMAIFGWVILEKLSLLSIGGYLCFLICPLIYLVLHLNSQIKCPRYSHIEYLLNDGDVKDE